jgi:hypothetical protein
VLFKVRATFQQHIPKKHKWFGIKIYKLCHSNGYTYNMTVYSYLGKDRKSATPSTTATYANVTGLTARIEHLGHNLHMDNFSSSPALFDDLHTKKINCCGTVRPIRKEGFWIQNEIEEGNTKVKGNLTAVV